MINYFHFDLTPFRSIWSQILAKKHGLPWRKFQKLGDLQQALGLSLQSICETVDKDLHPEFYSKEEVCRELELSPEELNEVSLTPNTRDIQKFKLHQRATHVFQGQHNYYFFFKWTHRLSSSSEK